VLYEECKLHDVDVNTFKQIGVLLGKAPEFVLMAIYNEQSSDSDIESDGDALKIRVLCCV